MSAQHTPGAGRDRLIAELREERDAAIAGGVSKLDRSHPSVDAIRARGAAARPVDGTSCRHRQGHRERIVIRTYIPDHDRGFWPTGWLVWVSVALGVFDMAMIINLVRLVVMR